MAWYEEKSITDIEVKDSLVKTLKFKLQEPIILEKCIDEVIKSSKIKDFGSYRVYYTFTHIDLKNKITERYNYYTNKPCKSANKTNQTTNLQ